ncbi:hypothetical protein DYN56_20855 [Salmonella enterica subsp. enterica serovar Johannesburg]|nr:hypothetical protein [Salmonella enterica subsp. enterica serovar Johannesburg]
MRIRGASGNKNFVVRVADNPNRDLQFFHLVASIKKAQSPAPFYLCSMPGRISVAPFGNNASTDLMATHYVLSGR